MSNSLLKDKTKQKELDKRGFTTLKLLEEKELEAIRRFYHEQHPEGAPEKIDGIHMTTWCSNLEYKLNIAQNLESLFEKACERNFEGYRRLNNVFIVKDPGETPFKVHQDWNVVDEKENFAFNVWMPLYDVNEENGALWVVEGTHKLKRNIRGSAYLFPDYSDYFPELEKAATSVNLKAGEAIVFYVNIIHGSPENRAQSERIASCFSIIPKDAPLTIYFQKQEGDKLEIHEPKDNFMYHYKHLRTETFERAPSAKPKGVLESHINKKITERELKNFIRKERRGLLSILKRKLDL